MKFKRGYRIKSAALVLILILGFLNLLVIMLTIGSDDLVTSLIVVMSFMACCVLTWFIFRVVYSIHCIWLVVSLVMLFVLIDIIFITNAKLVLDFIIM